MAWVAPRIWTALETATAAKFNEISSALNVVGGTTWNTYTPTWSASVTPPTLGNGSISGWYLLAGGWCEVEIALTIGSTTTAGSGSYTLTVPVASASAANVVLGTGLVFDSSAASPNNLFSQSVYRTSVSTAVAMTGAGGRWTSALPSAPATSDVISAKIKYRI